MTTYTIDTGTSTVQTKKMSNVMFVWVGSKSPAKPAVLPGDIFVVKQINPTLVLTFAGTSRVEVTVPRETFLRKLSSLFINKSKGTTP